MIFDQINETLVNIRDINCAYKCPLSNIVLVIMMQYRGACLRSGPVDDGVKCVWMCLLGGESLSTEQQKKDDNRAFRSIAWLICSV